MLLRSASTVGVGENLRGADKTPTGTWQRLLFVTPRALLLAAVKVVLGAYARNPFLLVRGTHSKHPHHFILHQPRVPLF